MKGATAGAAVLAVAVLLFPRVHAQSRVFTTGTRAELEVARRVGLGLLHVSAAQRGVGDELRVSRVHIDELSMAHTRVQQHVRGVPVFGGEAIVHLRTDGALFAETNNLLAHVTVDTTPRLTASAAIARALDEFGCLNCLTAPPRADLWIVRHDGIDHLAYRVQLRREDGTNETSLPVIFIDAHAGHVLSRYDNLQTGTGPSLYSGTVSVGTSPGASGGYFMENLSRRIGTFDMFDSVTTTLRFFDADDVWDADYHRAGLDVQYGSEQVLSYLSSVHGWNGLDGSGGPGWLPAHAGSGTLITSRVHYGVNVSNAFWNGFGTTYGDGDGNAFSPLVTLDIVAHEMTHGVTQFTANLLYSGEPGALNESWSDVFGAMVERYVRGQSANTWRIGEQAYTPAIGGDALRYMDDPHLASNHDLTTDDDPDHYSERYVGSADNGGVHVNSGIANKAFYLLAQGGSHHLGGSMTGIGADAAARIWFVALRSYMTSNTDFAGARAATMNAAAALHGTGSAQHSAVSAAWCLVGVGSCTDPTADSVTPSSGSGSSQSFVLQYSDPAGATNLVTAWAWFTATAGGSAASSCLVYYSRPANTINLLNDAGTSWSSAVPGTSAILANSQCSVAVSGVAASTLASTLSLTLPMTFKPAFAGLKGVYMYAANPGASSGWQLKGQWTVTVPSVFADSVTPNNGSGASETFDFQYSDNLGAGALRTTWVWFNSTLASTAANSCLVYYERVANRIFLIDSTGTGWSNGTPGTSTTLENGSCAVALAWSSATLTGNSLTVRLAITFRAAFAGVKNIYMYADSAGGSSSGWQQRGTYTVTGASAVVTADSVSPNAASGAARTQQIVALQYSDTAGVSDLSTTWVWFNATFAPSAANSCMIHYDRGANLLRLINDAGTDWLAGAPGASGTIQNRSCALALAASSVTPSGNTLTVTLAITFSNAFTGTKNIYMYANSVGGASSGWQTRGTYTVSGATIAVTADSVAPSNGSGTNETFTLQFSHTRGATQLRTVWVWFNATFASSAASSCLIYYDRGANVLHLINSAGSGWLAGTPGASATLENGSCAIALASANVTPAGDTLTLVLPLTFQSAFAETKNIYMYADGVSGATSGWQTRGTFTVTGVAGPTVSADLVLPDRGGAATQIFTMRYSDTLGPTDLRTVWVWFTTALTSSAANSCLAYYDRATNIVNLINDAGNGWLAGPLGSAGILQNGSCEINLALGSTFNSGISLTLNLPITFASTFGGLKNVYTYANSVGGVDSGWQLRGSWVLPAAGALSLAGTWTGTTAQNHPFTMVVDANGIATIQTDFALAGGCTGSVTVNGRFTPSVAIANNSFSLPVSGAGSSASIGGNFGSSTAAGGSFSVNVDACPGVRNTTWSATKI